LPGWRSGTHERDPIFDFRARRRRARSPHREPGGWIVSLVLGVAGAFLGGFIGRALGMYDADVTTGGFLMSLVGAIVLVAIYHAIVGRRRLR
jgi:uncharacterized membrane protein YeaQ/YmgE (transglycosylase-associated protein family)